MRDDINRHRRSGLREWENQPLVKQENTQTNEVAGRTEETARLRVRCQAVSKTRPSRCNSSTSEVPKVDSRQELPSVDLCLASTCPTRLYLLHWAEADARYPGRQGVRTLRSTKFWNSAPSDPQASETCGQPLRIQQQLVHHYEVANAAVARKLPDVYTRPAVDH